MIHPAFRIASLLWPLKPGTWKHNNGLDFDTLDWKGPFKSLLAMDIRITFLEGEVDQRISSIISGDGKGVFTGDTVGIKLGATWKLN